MNTHKNNEEDTIFPSVCNNTSVFQSNCAIKSPYDSHEYAARVNRTILFLCYYEMIASIKPVGILTIFIFYAIETAYAFFDVSFLYCIRLTFKTTCLKPARPLCIHI